MEQEMRYIWQVWQEGSFSRAAEKLYMTQPALSIAVKRVEAGLGAELFDRSRHPLELTQAGAACGLAGSAWAARTLSTATSWPARRRSLPQPGPGWSWS